jgi:hypothetical protein
VLTPKRQHSSVSLIALPRPAQPNDYATASDEIEDLLGRLPGIVAVYRAGTVSVPGISDLDRIAVVEGHDAVPSVWSDLSDQSRYLAMHTPFLVDQATFQRHRWFAFIEPLSLSFGSPVDLEDRPSPEYSEPLMGAESLAVCLLRLVKQISTGRLKVRQLLCELHNVRHGLTLSRLGRSDAPSAWRLATDVAKLRAEWFAAQESWRTELIGDIVERAGPALVGALWALGERSERVKSAPAPVKLGAPWSNVALVPSESPQSALSDVRRVGFPVSRSARISELWWRSTRPRIPLHPAVLGVLAGRNREHAEFRATRDQIVRSYRRFLETNRRGYSGVGLAMPFLGS